MAKKSPPPASTKNGRNAEAGGVVIPLPVPAPPTQLASPAALRPAATEWLSTDRRPRQALDKLIERPDAAKLVRATPVQPLFLFIKEIGLADAGPLMGLVSTEQVQAFLDMDVWERDRLSVGHLVPWLEALVALGPNKLAAHVRRLDPELLTTALGSRVRIYELGDDEPPPPDEPEGTFFATPDRFYLIDILPDPDGDTDAPALIQRFLETLYRGDLELARSIVQSARWDVGTETEEQAYRFRSGRMADLGYIEHYEALKVYVLLDPAAPPPAAELLAKPAATPAVDESAQALRRLPSFLLDDGESTFARAVGHLSEEEQGQIFAHLLLLANLAMSADCVELGNAAAAREVLRRTAGYLSLGLELRLLPPGMRGLGAQGARPPEGVQVNIAQAAEELRTVSLLYLFRVGYSLTVQLRKLALFLVESNPGRRPPGEAVEDEASRSRAPGALTSLAPREDPAGLLPSRLAEPLRGLLRVRPLYSGFLDPSPASESGPGLSLAPSMRPFTSLRDLGRAAALLADLSTLARFLTTGLGLRTDNLAEQLATTSPGAAEVKLVDLVGTMLANQLLKRPPVFVPIRRSDLPALRRLAASAPGSRGLPPSLQEDLRGAVRQRVEERALGPAEIAALVTPTSLKLVDEALEALGRGLNGLPDELPPALADAVARLDGLVLA